MLDKYIKELVQYGIDCGLISEVERIYSTNMILEVFNKDDFEDVPIDDSIALCDVLEKLCDEACSLGIIENSITYRDLFDTKLMNCIMPRPTNVIDTFWNKYSESPKIATDFYYSFSQNSNYIRGDRIAKDMKWTYTSKYGDIDITINLSKPEKDPKAIAAAKNAVNTSYPKCQLCMENVGYHGRVNHPARQNHRIIPITINDSEWGFQYSPYVYYNEHCIVFNGQHIPMKIEKATFRKLFDFIKMFPHYFLGSNADLPIVGGSILSHDHFQGGNYTFAMAKAESVKDFTVTGFEDVKCSIIRWPLSVIRIKSSDTERLIELGEHILNVWHGYTDEDSFIYANTNGELHNTITPIARYRNGMYELDLALRNNITTDEFPFGVFHPHEELHHIKKENIGLIEVMGLAVLPSRLKGEMNLLADYIVNRKDISSNSDIKKHQLWVEEFMPNYKAINADNVIDILKMEIGKVFVQVLEDAGVFKCDDSGLKKFERFITTL